MIHLGQDFVYAHFLLHAFLWFVTLGSSTSSSGQKRTTSISSKYQRFDTSWEDWEPLDRRYLLEAAVEELKQVSFCVYVVRKCCTPIIKCI